MPSDRFNIYDNTPPVSWVECQSENRPELTPMERILEQFETLGTIEGRTDLEVANLVTELLYARHDFFKEGEWYALFQSGVMLYAVPRTRARAAYAHIPQRDFIGEVHSGMITPQIMEVVSAWRNSL